MYLQKYPKRTTLPEALVSSNFTERGDELKVRVSIINGRTSINAKHKEPSAETGDVIVV